MKLKIHILATFLLFAVKIHGQTIYLKGYQYIYYFDLNTCTATDSVKVNDLNFSAIALNKDGNIYGCSLNQYTIKTDTVYMLNPVTKTVSIKCTSLPSLGHSASVGACFDKNDNLLFIDYNTTTASTHVYKYNINSCSVVADYDLDTILGIDGDIEFANGLLYITSKCAIWQIDLDGNTKPVKVFNSTYPCDASVYNGYYGILYACYQNTPTFFVSNYESPITKLYRYDPFTGQRVWQCDLSFGCADAANYSPDVNFFYLGPDTTLCAGFNFQLKTNIANTQWSTGQTGSSINVTQAGIYWAKVTSSCGTYSDTIIVKTNAAPVPLFIGNDTTVCAGSTITIRSNLSNTIWKPGVSGSQINVTVNKDTTIIAKIPFTACNTIDTMFDTLNIKADKNEALNITSSASVFCSQPITLTSSYPNSIWNNGVTANQIIITNSGSYWASFTNACGIHRDTILIRSNNPIELNIGRDTIICPNTSIVLTSTIPGITWWNGIKAQQMTVNTAGIYWATYRDSCTNYTDSIKIDAYNPPIPLFIGNDTSVCKGSSILTYSNLSSVTWQDASVADTFRMTINNNAIIKARIENKCTAGGFNMDERIIDVIEESIIINADKTEICKNDSVLLQSNRSNTKWWFPDSTEQTASSVNAFIIGKYVATAQGECSKLRDSILIREYCVETCNIYVPTAFSPNNDNINDNFFPFFECDTLRNYQMEIYNRWGELVFKSDNINDHWNGKQNGKDCQTDNYGWLINYNDKKMKGIVILLR